MLAPLPWIWQTAILVVVGAATGAFINWAIYGWGFHRWPYSPWRAAEGKASPRRWSDRIPVLGWLGLRRDASRFGRTFWVRPMLIELAWAVGTPWFFHWQLSGGLTGGVVPPVEMAETWFWGQTGLVALMTIATFIDLDQRLIPDSITVSGTVLALLILAIWPAFRLPQVIAGLAAHPAIEPLHFFSPDTLPAWHREAAGCGIALAIWIGWVLALYPKTILPQFGFRSIRVMLASMVRVLKPKRLRVRTYFRRQAIGLLILGATGMAAIPIAWSLLGEEHLDSLFGALVGLGFAGALVWLVRIIGGFALGQEAMGFGDVTLMAMIGAFLGWQPALLIFALAPFAGLFVTLANYAITRENELAFGPYLCVAAWGIILGWATVWPRARGGIFFVGPTTLAGMLIVGLVLFALMLISIAWFKQWYSGGDE